jgi:hypothetical protein
MRSHGGSLFEAIYVGRCSSALVEQAHRLAVDILGDVHDARWLIDMSALTGADVGARDGGVRLMQDLLARGAQEFAVVLTNSAVRMLFSAVVFATGMPVRFFDSRAAAMGRLHGRLSSDSFVVPRATRPPDETR